MSKRTELARMIAAVDQLAEAMKKKLRKKAREGRSGGLDPANRYMVENYLMNHVYRLSSICPHCRVSSGEHDHDEAARQAIDVANLAMMLWVMGGKPR